MQFLNFKLPLDAYSSLGVTKHLIWQLHSRCRPKGNLCLQWDWNQHSSLWQPNVLIITMETPTAPGESPPLLTSSLLTVIIFFGMLSIISTAISRADYCQTCLNQEITLVEPVSGSKNKANRSPNETHHATIYRNRWLTNSLSGKDQKDISLTSGIQWGKG